MACRGLLTVGTVLPQCRPAVLSSRHAATQIKLEALVQSQPSSRPTGVVLFSGPHASGRTRSPVWACTASSSRVLLRLPSYHFPGTHIPARPRSRCLTQQGSSPAHHLARDGVCTRAPCHRPCPSPSRLLLRTPSLYFQSAHGLLCPTPCVISSRTGDSEPDSLSSKCYSGNHTDEPSGKRQDKPNPAATPRLYTPCSFPSAVHVIVS